MDKRFLSILAAIVVIFIGVFIFTQGGNDKDNGSSNGSSSTSQGTNHVLGENQKNVTLVEYGDFQCPVCEAYYLPVKEAVAKHSKDIKFQFRNLPLTAIHPNAFSAARAAEAADMQGKYWEMYNMLYEQANWQVWTNTPNPVPLFENYAKTLGLNITKYKQDYASEKVNSLINADLAAFNKTGQDKATPTFFINGEHVANSKLAGPGGQPTAESISQYIQSVIDKKQ